MEPSQIAKACEETVSINQVLPKHAAELIVKLLRKHEGNCVVERVVVDFVTGALKTEPNLTLDERLKMCSTVHN